MPIDVASLITGATYEPVVQCAADGEVHTQALIVDPLVALGNRIQFIRNRLDQFVAEVRDDFNVLIDKSGDADPHLLCDTPWNLLAINSPTISFSVADLGGDSGVGGLNFGTVGGAAIEAMICKSASRWRYGNIASVIARVSMSSIASGMGCEVGFVSALDPTPGNPGGTAVTAFFDPTVSPNWQLRTRNSGGTTGLVNTGVAVVAGGAIFSVVELTYDGTNYALRADGGAAVVATTGIPAATDVGVPTWRIKTPNAGANRNTTIDLFVARGRVSRV